MQEPPPPDHKVRVTVISGGLEVDGVLCELRLPKRVRERIEVRLLPSDEQQFGKVTSHFKFGIKYAEGGLRIAANTIYIDRAGGTMWAADVHEHEVRGTAADLTITREWLSSSDHHVVFVLTPNVFLRPAKIINSSYTGDVRVESVDRVAFPCLRDAGWVLFDHHYRHQKSDNGTVTFPELVAECELPGEVTPEAVIEGLDDFLLLASYATRQRVVCLGWSGATSDGYIQHFRHNLTLPQELPGHSFNETLIHQEHFIEFMRIGYGQFRDHPQKPLLRQALHRATWYRDSESAITAGYLMLYATLESLTQLFVQMKPDIGVNVTDPDQWRAFRRILHKVVKRFLPKNKRDGVYKAIGGLNRAPFADVLRALCQEFRVDLADLWPVTDAQGGITLAQIRNRLIHGYFTGEEFEWRVVIAKTHLEAVVDRLLLAVLGWDWRESRASIWSMAALTAYKRERWERARAELTAMA